MHSHDEIERACLNLIQGVSPHELDAGTVFVDQGAESDAAFYLAAGTVTVFSRTNFGEVPLATLIAPRLIGEVGTLAGLPRTASLRAETDITLYRLKRDHLTAVATSNPALLFSVIAHLGEQLTAINKTLALFTNGLRALEADDFDATVMDDLRHPPPELADFSSAFRRFAGEISEKRRTGQEMASAALIQQSLLPSEALLQPVSAKLQVFATVKPARRVGGDFYDYFLLDDRRIAFAVGDVCGKGIPASLFASIVVTVLRTEARKSPSLAQAMAEANRIICRDNAANLFATLFMAVLDIERGRLTYVNCGHNAPIIASSAGDLRTLPRTGIPLGLFEDKFPEEAYETLSQDDFLICFTDGVTEANNPEQLEFGDERLLEIAASLGQMPPASAAASILTAVESFVAGSEQSDDITLMVMRRAHAV